MFKKNDVIIVYLILLAIFLGLFIASVLAFYTFHKNSNTIQSGIYIKGINVSGLSKEVAKETVEEELKYKMNDHIFLQYKNYEYYVAVEQIEAGFDIESSVEFAYNVARSGDFLQDVQDYISVLMSNIEIEPVLKYNEKELVKYLENIQSNLPDQLKQSDYYIDEDQIIITNGVNGAGIYMEELESEIIEAISEISYNNRIIDIPTYVEYPEPINVDSIHEETYREVQNAYFTTVPYAVYADVVGIDFDVDRLKNLIEENNQEEYVAKLKYTMPEVTTNDLGMEAFPHLIATFSTQYVNNPDRTTNLRLASDKINNTVVMPGETFSYNRVVGKRTIDAGYKEAPIFQNGQVEAGLGGGICQISSTLYNTVIFANLEIVSRRNHMFIPSYIGGGRDATVVWGSTDFKFENTRNYPIKIKSSVNNGSATVSIYGLRNELEYDISIETSVVRSVPYKTEYQNNNRYTSGTVIQAGHNGSVVDSYKVYKLDGRVVEKERLSRDTYSAMNKIIAR